MKKTALLLVLSLCMLLCACRRMAPAAGDTSAPLPTRETQEEGMISPETPAKSSPAPVETSASPAPSQTASTAQPESDCPIPMDKAAPLLQALAESLVLDGDADADFTRYPGAQLADRIFARLLRDGNMDEAFSSVEYAEGSVSLERKELESLYLDCFSEGKLESLPGENAYGYEEKGRAVFAFPDRKELQFSVQLTDWKPLVEDGYYEMELQLFWAYPEDAQASLGGSVRCWVKLDDDSPYGLGLALLETQMSLRPGDDFGAHPARDVEMIMPMLHAVAKACLETGAGFEENPSGSFAFEAAYALLNSYGEDFGLDLSSSAVHIPEETMKRAMQALFGPEYQAPSSVPSALRGKLKADGGGYTLTRSEEETTPVFAEYAVNMNAIEVITISLRTGDKTENSPWRFHGSAAVAVNALSEGELPYRNRYAESVLFTPEHKN